MHTKGNKESLLSRTIIRLCCKSIAPCYRVIAKGLTHHSTGPRACGARPVNSNVRVPMELPVRFAIRLLLAIAIAALGLTGCSKAPPMDPWEAVKLARETKNRADLITALHQLPAEVYAVKLFADCRSDETQCIKATEILEFAFALTEGDKSPEARIMCELNKVFALDYLIGIDTNLQFKLAENMSEAESAAIRARLRNIWTLQDRYIKQCERYK